MRIIQFDDIPEFHRDTQTMKHIGTLLGSRVTALPQLISLKRELTLSLLTDGLKNTFSKERQSNTEGLNSMIFEWRFQQNYTPRIRIVETCTDTGRGRTPINLILENNYYSKNDTFALSDPRISLFVTQAPERLGPNRWRYVCILNGNDNTREVNPSLLRAGETTTYRSNYFGELSKEGYSKYMYNTEIFRGFLSRHRVGKRISGDFANYVFFEVKNDKSKYDYFKALEPEKELIDYYLLTREQHLLFGENNHDVNGKCLLQDEMGNDIPMGSGVIEQIERYCDKFSYSTLTTSIFDDAIDSVIQRTGKYTGNHITVICNHLGLKQAMDAMLNKLRDFAQLGAWYYTRDKNEVNVGANFQQYHYNHNYLTFTIDEALTKEYRDFGYLVFLDTSLINGKANVQTFTLKGREMLTGTLRGLGGADGRSSGDIATPIDGSEMHIMGYSGIVVFNPYAGFIMKENVI